MDTPTLAALLGWSVSDGTYAGGAHRLSSPDGWRLFVYPDGRAVLAPPSALVRIRLAGVWGAERVGELARVVSEITGAVRAAGVAA